MSLINATHSFLPWARRGLAAQIQETEIYDGVNTPATPVADERAKIKAYVHLKVNNNAIPGNSVSPVSVDLQIIGPGDVIGIHNDVVVKTEPHNWITNFEPHSFPFIDFYEEDFPWRYTPAVATTPTTITAGGKLRPWITLVVLKEDEFDKVTLPDAPLNAIALKTATPPANRPLPKNDELWAWAHVSVDETLSGADLDARIVDLNTKVNANPNIAISRIICPRKLEENTSYYAFLIPTYETGRLAGLGLSTTGVKAQAAAWDHLTAWPAPPATNLSALGTFPVYYEWYFRTGATGDFEYLVRQVKPRIADSRVGKRLMDIQAPGYGLSFTAGLAGTTAGTELLEGALRVPLLGEPVFPSLALNAQGTAERKFSDDLKAFVNLGEDMLTASVNPMTSQNFPALGDPTIASDPIVAPPLYGRWHALRSKVDRADVNLNWLNELNLDPRYRVAASLGGDYIRKHQEFLMDKAWEQVGAVMKANRLALQAQFSQAASEAMHAKHIASQPIEQLLPMTSNVHAKINTGSVTLKQDAIDSSLPESASSSTFRKISRPTGVLMKRLDASINLPANNPLGKMIQGALAPVAAKQAPGALATTFSLSSLNTAVASIASVSNPASIPFNISLPSGPVVAPSATVAANFKSSFAPFNNVFNTTTNWTAPATAPNLPTTTNVVSDSIDPAVTHVNSFYDSVTFTNQPTNTPVPDTIVPAWAAPAFRLPMYESLKELGTDYFIPNLNLLPQNSMTLLESNQKFIEAFLAGANYEMGRELLWREYPTDQRGTYFRHFWSSTDSLLQEANTPDIRPIDQWLSTSALGSHSARTGANTANNLVLAIRGDFLKKFPNAVIFALEADWDRTNGISYTAPRVIKLDSQSPPQETKKYPIFSAKIDPDITFLGFDLTRVQAKGNRYNDDPTNNPRSPGWFFVIMERPGELRFGIDYPLSTTPVNPTILSNWNELTWNHVNTNPSNNYLLLGTTAAITNVGNKKLPPLNGEPTNWAEDSGAMAMILYQNPVKVLIHANEMIP